MPSVSDMKIGEWKQKKEFIPRYVLKLQGTALIVGDIFRLGNFWRIEASFGSVFKTIENIPVEGNTLEHCKMIWVDLMNNKVLPKIFK
jgi:hypothetical protein